MSARSSEDEYAALEEADKLLLADCYPDLKRKLEKSIERSRKRPAPMRRVPAAAPIPVFNISSDEDEVEVNKAISKDEDEEEVQLLDDSPVLRKEDLDDLCRRSEDYSFHSPRSTQVNKAFFSDDESPPREFVADEQEVEEMDGSYVVNPRFSSSFEEVDAGEIAEEEAEPEGESLQESREEEEEAHGDEESIHSSDESFIDDEEEGESEMSADRSFRPVAVGTPQNRRVLPARSTRNNYFTATGKSLNPSKKGPSAAEISPSGKSARKRQSESDEGSGEESFELYLRKLREEDAKKREKEEKTVSSDDEGGKELEDSFVVSDDDDDVIDDEYENGSEEEEEEEEGGVWGQSDSSRDSDEEKENRPRKERKERDIEQGKPAKKKNLLLDLADSFNSPSVRGVDKDARDPDRHFLLSLSENYDGKRRHPDAEVFVKKGVKGEKSRAALVQRLFQLYNREIFDEKLPSDMEIRFNGRLRKTAGYCKMSLRTMKATIELSPKVCSKPDRIRDTLAHEMCHAAVFVVNKLIKEGHGPVWKSWTQAFSSRFRGFPIPSRCHSYEIEAKFVYECDGCGQLVKRHSNSLDTQKKGCGICDGRFTLRQNAEMEGKKRGANAFALFVKDNYGEEKKGGKSHKEIMQVLSARFKISKAEANGAQERSVKKLDLDLSIMSIHDEE